jgi:hypothetical protein
MDGPLHDLGPQAAQRRILAVPPAQGGRVGLRGVRDLHEGVPHEPGGDPDGEVGFDGALGVHPLRSHQWVGTTLDGYWTVFAASAIASYGSQIGALTFNEKETGNGRAPQRDPPPKAARGFR